MRAHNVNGVFYDSNAYLIDAKRKTLVDAGIDGLRVLKSIPRDLDLIILTHCHYDHIAAVPEIVKATGAQVAMHEKDIQLIKSDRMSGSMLFGEKLPPVNVDIQLKGGESIDLGDISLEVLHTPGHTPGSICLYEKKEKVLFTGDTVFEGGSFGRTDLGGDSGHIISSLLALTKLDVDVLYPGHGNAVMKDARGSLNASYRNARHMMF